MKEKKAGRRKRSEDGLLERSRNKRKKKEFWEYIETFDIVGLTETWIDEQTEWKRVKGKLPSGFRWEIQGAIKKRIRGELAEETLNN